MISDMSEILCQKFCHNLLFSVTSSKTCNYSRHFDWWVIKQLLKALLIPGTRRKKRKTKIDPTKAVQQEAIPFYRLPVDEKIRARVDKPFFRRFSCLLAFRVLSCPVVSCLVLSCLVLSCLVLSRLVSSCLVLSCLVLSCLVLSCLVLSCLVLSCLVLVSPFDLLPCVV